MPGAQAVLDVSPRAVDAVAGEFLLQRATEEAEADTVDQMGDRPGT
jgi:hypothetical protein